eukprot:9097911-Alexandrium_andersonii.AAC.1
MRCRPSDFYPSGAARREAGARALSRDEAGGDDGIVVLGERADLRLGSLTGYASLPQIGHTLSHC